MVAKISNEPVVRRTYASLAHAGAPIDASLAIAALTQSSEPPLQRPHEPRHSIPKVRLDEVRTRVCIDRGRLLRLALQVVTGVPRNFVCLAPPLRLIHPVRVPPIAELVRTPDRELKAHWCPVPLELVDAGRVRARLVR